MQIDEAERGSRSGRRPSTSDGGDGPSAADVVARLRGDLADIIFQAREERIPRRRPRIIPRAKTRDYDTKALAEIVERVVYARPDRIHPATRTFQRSAVSVNEELASLPTLSRGPNASSGLGPALRVSFIRSRSHLKTFLAERARTAAFAPTCPIRSRAATFTASDQASDRRGECRSPPMRRVRRSCRPPDRTVGAARGLDARSSCASALPR